MDTNTNDLVRNINSVIEEMWGLANLTRQKLASSGDISKLRIDADKLEDLLQKYLTLGLKVIPETTIWMGKEMIEASRDIADGYERLQALDL